MADVPSTTKGAAGSRDPPAPSAVSRASTVPASSSSGTVSSSGAKPEPLRSHTLSVATTSTVASGSNSQRDARRPSRALPASQANASFARSPSFQALAEAGEESQSAIDPLSQHIIKRTNTEKSIPLKLRGQASHETEAGGTDGASNFSPTEQGPIRRDTGPPQKPSKEKKKGVSFLSRFIGNKRKDQFANLNDNESELDDDRMDAEVFAQPIGFIPRFPPPPKYIRVRAHYKKQKTFDRVFVAQELQGADMPGDASDKNAPSTAASEAQYGSKTERAVWAMEFSKDGKYLASAGQDRKVRVWAVISTSEDRQEHELEEEEAKGEQAGLRLAAPVFKSKPIRVYEGHTGCVLDLSWSKNNFLLSTSMDRTVRLWHVSRSECLCCFKHSDFVTSIQFHPRDDRFFLAGSLDSKLRLWSIPDKSVAFWATVPDMITAVAFTPDGKYSIAGCLNGLCLLYETDGLKAHGQIHVRSARGRNSKGSKITGIDTISQPPNDPNGDVKLLITSNDSRIRLYNFKDRALEAKFRGNENTCSQIRASFSDDGKHIICGSEDRRPYIWPTGSGEKESDKRAVEIFETHSSIVTSAIMAPTKTKQLLGFSGDPVYDLCNPPPITLVSLAESSMHSRSRSEGVVQRKDDSNSSTPQATESTKSPKANESPAYLARSTHPSGNIILAADYSGKIKVLRQDCAHQKRRNESWDGSSTFSKKILGRSNSARHSIASSIGRESTHKTPSERIISWRNSVIGTELTSVDNGQGTRTRSASPRKSMSRLSRYSSPVQNPVRAGPETPSASTISPPPSIHKSSMESSRRSGVDAPSKPTIIRTPEPESRPSSPTPPAATQSDVPLWMDQSYAYWSKTAHAAQVASAHRSSNLLDPRHIPSPGRKQSVGSALSSDCSSLTGDTEEGEVLRCEYCKGTNFRATRTRNGKQRLICGRCNRPVS